ncbi:FAD-dependent oxidoreductase [Pseudonocardia sp. Cha107L01]|jgi:2-polyprenyl-6-methoxyphenol hydroxylase-like FAD-dependent oxidoreductase|uniref:FAD-dependent oxidoreductase n=1 Tax=Pseudonocardia sp. Cha107L01 TaxID=3457576 RepID=UPI00403ECC2C
MAMYGLGDHGVVLGASMGGLCAGAVLAQTFQQVTVVDRDVLPEVGAVRRGVPQGRHAHALLPRGAQIIEELFPGILSELAASGVPVLHDMAEFYFCTGGHLLCSADHPLSPFAMYQPSRAHLEHSVRTRLRALPNVEIIPSCEAVGLTTNDGHRRVTGVRLLRNGGVEDSIEADLVVDATGRSGRARTWLSELGYQPPPEEQVPIDIKYVSRHLRVAPASLGRVKMVIIGAVPARPTTLFLLAEEDDRWTLTLGGYGGHHPPTDPRGFLQFAQEIAPPHIFAAIRDAELLDELVPHRFPANLRRRYERMSQFPAGLLVFGDALCSFNPVYGQGMTVATLQAYALRDCLAEGDTDLPRRFFRAAARSIDTAWQLVLGGDLALPQVSGRLPLTARLANAYLDRLFAAARDDSALVEQFARVSWLVDPPRKLLRPSIVRRVLAGSRRRRTAPLTGTQPADRDPIPPSPAKPI